MNTINKNIITGTILALTVVDVVAHDTTHIHPMITKKISDLISVTDKTTGAYSEIYLPNPLDPIERGLYWGKDRDLDADELTLDILINDQLELYGKEDLTTDDINNGVSHYDNVMDGVVQEDAPVDKVLSHFYHATSGEPLSLNGVPVLTPSINGLVPAVPSADKAMAFFAEAIEWYNGYTEASKKVGYFKFGQSLHHVEDMSSPAHIHNDPHLTIPTDAERDDYEGWFLPSEKRFKHSADETRNKVDEYFGDISDSTNLYQVQRVTNPWIDIWGTNKAESMVRYFYDKTVYNGTLEFPYSSIATVPILNIIGKFTNPVPPNINDDSELEKMYPACSDTLTNHCLLWQEDTPDTPAYYEIKGIGGFHHQYSVWIKNAWWAIEIEDNPEILKSKNAIFSGQFYIEQLALNNTETQPLGDVQTIPHILPNAFPSNDVNNPENLNINNLSLMEIYARNLLKPAVEYSAGFTQYWYDVANTPPYLKQVQVTQAGNGNLPDNVIYSAGWVDETEELSHTYNQLDKCWAEAFFCPPNIISPKRINRTIRRYFEIAYGDNFTADNIRHINAKNKMQLVLVFNEPITNITVLKLGDYDAEGNCVTGKVCLDITPVRDPTTNKYPADVLAPDSDDSVWTIAVEPAAFSSLNGKVQLTVAALDKNNHTAGKMINGTIDTSGSELDSTPTTPAKRNLFKVEADPKSNYYPWHKYNENDVSLVPEEAEADEAFSYDPGADTHYTLLFDTVAPVGSIAVDLVLPQPE